METVTALSPVYQEPIPGCECPSSVTGLSAAVLLFES